MYPPFEEFRSWSHSPTVNGKIRYKANTMSSSVTRYRCIGILKGKYILQQAIFGVSAPNALRGDSSLLTGCTNRAYGKLASAVRGETASLGVTLGSWRQSWVMIALRAKQISQIARSATVAARRRNRALRILRNRLPPGVAVPQDLLPVGSANIFLEGIFGWLPLLGDIHGAAQALANPIPTGDWLRFCASDASATGGIPPGFDSYKSLKWSTTTKCRVTMACKVSIDNPNVWLLNKLGLINPAVVIWDLIPWSFVVGFFGNVNQVLSSYTAFAGLNVSDASTTVRWDVTETWTVRNWQTGAPNDYSMEENCSHYRRRKTRSLGLTMPTLKLRMPTVEMTSALIALSLMAQQVSQLEYFKPSKRK